jgi:hypothetical protein
MAQERRRPVDEILTPGSGTARARQFSTFPRERAPRGTEWMFRAATSQLPREPQLRSCGEVRIERGDRRLIDFEHRALHEPTVDTGEPVWLQLEAHEGREVVTLGGRDLPAGGILECEPSVEGGIPYRMAPSSPSERARDSDSLMRRDPTPRPWSVGRTPRGPIAMTGVPADSEPWMCAVVLIRQPAMRPSTMATSDWRRSGW